MENNAIEINLLGKIYLIDSKNSRIVQKENPEISIHWHYLSDNQWDAVERAMDEANDY